MWSGGGKVGLGGAVGLCVGKWGLGGHKWIPGGQRCSLGGTVGFEEGLFG